MTEQNETRIRTREQVMSRSAHSESPRVGILLANLGTPEAPDTPSLRRYLREFLWDRRVVEVPRPLWWLILNGLIVPFRSPRSARAYRRVWTERGSPLLFHTRDLAAGLVRELDRTLPRVRVYPVMRYGRPSISEALEKARDENVQRLLVLPLYPQYSATTTASVFDGLARALAEVRWVPEIRFVSHYHQDNGWLEAIAGRIRSFQEDHGKPDRLLFSFHGIPKNYLLDGDPYYCQCQASARRIAERLGLADDDWQVSFQSRLGRAEWLKPYTDKTLVELGKAGMKHLQVVCPGFAVDCLETIDEIGNEGAQEFVQAGGGRLEYIPALNAGDDHVAALAGICRSHGAGWPEFSGTVAATGQELRDRIRRAGQAARFLGLPDS